MANGTPIDNDPKPTTGGSETKNLSELLKSVQAIQKQIEKTEKKADRRRRSGAGGRGDAGGRQGGGGQGAMGRGGYLDPGELLKFSKIFSTAGKAFRAIPVLFLAKAISQVYGAINRLTPDIKALRETEKVAAGINLEVSRASFESGKQIAESIGKEVAAVQGLKFAYLSHEVGIEMHGKGMKNLFRASLRTGEDIKKLTSGIRDATFGLGDGAQMDDVAFSLNQMSGALKLSRTELVAAMNSVSSKLKDNLAALGGNGVAYSKATAALRGLIKDPGAFKSMTSELENLLVGPQGLQRSLMLGVSKSRMALLGGGDMGDMLTSMLTVLKQGFDQTQRHIGPLKGTPIGPLMVDSLNKAGKINAGMARAWRGLTNRLRERFGDQIDVQDPREVVNHLMTMQKNQKQFANTFDSFKTAVMMPIMNALTEMAIQLKEWLQVHSTTLRNLAEQIGNIIIKAMAGILRLGSAAGNVGDSLGGLTRAAAVLVAPKVLGKGRDLVQGASRKIGRGLRLERARALRAGQIAPGLAKAGARAIGAGGTALAGKTLGKAVPLVGLALLGVELFNIWNKTSSDIGEIAGTENEIRQLIDNIGKDTGSLATIAGDAKGKSDTHKALLSNIQGFAAAQMRQTAKVVGKLGDLTNLTQAQTEAIEREKELKVEFMNPFTSPVDNVIQRGFSPHLTRI